MAHIVQSRPAVLLALVIVSLSASPARAQTAWVPTTIGDIFGIAHDLSDYGQAVGYRAVVPGSVFTAFSWTPEGGRVDLGTLGGTFTIANGVNNAGTVVGYSNVGGREPGRPVDRQAALKEMRSTQVI